MNFKKVDLNDTNIKKYKSKHKGLSHIRTGKDYKGYIYIDDKDNVVGFINMRISDKYIQAIEVSPEYQGKGLGKTLLNELIKMGATRLSVNKKNTKAKKMYDKLFKVEKEDKYMYYMVLETRKYFKEGRGITIMEGFSFEDINKSHHKNNVIIENISKNNILTENLEILLEADDDLGPTDYNADDLGTDAVADDTGGDEDLGPTDYNDDTTDDTGDTTDDTTDETTDDTGDEDLNTDDSTDDDLDSLESDADDPTAEPSGEDDGTGDDVENSNDEQMNNEDQNNDKENNKFLIKDYLELYNRLDEILEKINSNEKFKFSRDVVYNKARLNIEKIRDMLFDYITQTFNKESYVSNLYHFNLVIQAININIAMIEKSPTIAEISERNKEKQNKNEKTKRSK